MSEEKNNFSRFGTDFQQKLCSICLNDREFADQFSEVLDFNYFEVKYLQIVLKSIYDYREKYKMHPTLDAIHIVLSELALKNETNSSFKQAVDYIDQIKNQTTIKDEKFVRDTALEFCKKQVLKKALVQSVDLLAKSSFDEIKIVIDEALKKGVTRDLGHDYVRDCESRFDTKARLVIPTPWAEINDLTGGGFGRGDLHIMIAPTGMGKSHLMVDFGAYALQNGYKGVHYTLELSATKTGWRYDANISQIDVNLRREGKEEIKSSVRALKSNLIIREWPTKSASVLTIRSHLDKLAQNDFKPDFIIVDYADLLKPVSKFTEKRNQLEEIIEELRAIASEYNAAVITASQANRCLVLGQKVDTPNGKVQIETLKIGDQILTHLGYKKVVNVFPIETQPTYEIVLKSGRKILCSGKHEFPTANGDLKSIFDGLSPGDKLYVRK